MADTYGVLPADIAAELPGIFPGGFSATTLPSDTLVANFIAGADLAVTLKLRDTTGTTPLVTDAAAPLAKRYIIEIVKAQVLRVAYAGRDPIQVDTVVKPYELLAKTSLDMLATLDAQAVGTGDASSRVMTSLGASGLPSRDLLITDADLDPSSRGRF